MNLEYEPNTRKENKYKNSKLTILKNIHHKK